MKWIVMITYLSGQVVVYPDEEIDSRSWCLLVAGIRSVMIEGQQGLKNTYGCAVVVHELRKSAAP